MNNLLLTFIFLLTFQFVAVAGSDIVTGDSLPEYHLRTPGQEFLQEFRNDPTFNYTIEKSTPDWWQRVKWWILKHLFGKHEYTNTEWLDWALRAMAAILVAFMIYKLVRSKYLFAPSDKPQELPGGIDLLADGTLNQLSYTQLLEQAVGKGDYPLAVRIHYWYILWLMDNQGWIRLDAHKTNRSYLYELKKENFRSGFARLTHIFNCVCYGEFQVDIALYGQLKQEFEAFEKQITNEGKA